MFWFGLGDREFDKFFCSGKKVLSPVMLGFWLSGREFYDKVVVTVFYLEFPLQGFLGVLGYSLLHPHG